MANQVFETVRTVLAVREYRPGEIPADVLERIVDAGRLTASGMNRQPWHFVLVQERESLQELGRLVKTGPYIASASAAVVVACEKSNRLAIPDTSRAIQSMILTAWADGVASNWAGFAGLDEVRQHFGVPDSYEVMAVIPLGYPAREIGKGRKNRKPLEEVVSAERFGNPLHRP